MVEVDVQTISIAVASASVVAGVIYYSFQIRHQNKMRQTDLVMRLYAQFSSVEFQRTLEKVMKNEAKDFDEYNKKYGWSEALSVIVFFEGIAILLNRKLIDLDLVGEMFSIVIKTTWEKNRDIILEARKAQNQPMLFGWSEYLYKEIKKREKKLGLKA